MTADERYKERMVKIKPLLDELFARLETVQVSGKSALAKAVRYALHEKPFFYTFLQNGNVPPDNNRAENAIRPFAIGRKNWLFSNTANGAKASAVLYSITATAQANGVDVNRNLPMSQSVVNCVCRRQNRTDTDLEPHLAGLRTALCRSRTALERKPA